MQPSNSLIVTDLKIHYLTLIETIFLTKEKTIFFSKRKFLAKKKRRPIFHLPIVLPPIYE
jgi:hypothetical protein